MVTRKSSKLDPVILEMPAEKMAVVHLKGAPDKVFPAAMPAMYGSVYTLKFDLKKKGLETFKIEAPRARYPDAHLVSKDSWTIDMGIPVPEDTVSLPQKVPASPVGLETWEYGTVAQILHLGSYNSEGESVARLHKFISDNGYEIAGPHEEEYLTRPEAKVVKTIIRYRIKKK
jgi:hypothetical protein